MKPVFYFIFLILIMGCTKTTEETCVNNTINVTVETIRYMNVTSYVNVTMPCNCTNITVYLNSTTAQRWEDDYVFELIRRISYLEGRDDDYINVSSEIELEDCIDRLYNCNKTLEDLREMLNE